MPNAHPKAGWAFLAIACAGVICCSSAAAATTAAAAAVAAVVAAVPAGTAAGVAAAAIVAPAAVAAAAEQDDKDQNQPQATVAPTTITVTHRQEPPIQDGDLSAGLSSSYAVGAGMCAHSFFLPRMVSVALQHRSARSDCVAAGSFKAPSQWAQNSSTEL